MSDMVERIAKALRESDIDHGHADEGTELGSYFAPARAAIEAMREPTESMWDAATKAAERDEAHMSTYHCVGEAYRAAIDEALK